MKTTARGKKTKVRTVPMQRCGQLPEMEDCFARTRYHRIAACDLDGASRIISENESDQKGTVPHWIGVPHWSLIGRYFR